MAPRANTKDDMLDVLLKVLGVVPEGVVTGASLGLRSDEPATLWVAAFTAAAVYAVVMYLREAALSRPGRLALGVLRFAALLLLAAVLFQPVLEVRMEVPVEPKLLVLVDASESMDIRDVRKSDQDLAAAARAMGRLPEGAPIERMTKDEREDLATVARRELSAALLAGPAGDLFSSLEERADVHYFRFARSLEPAAGPDELAEALASVAGDARAGFAAGAIATEERTPAPDGGATHLGDALLDAADEFPGAPLAGIVLLTDGASNAGTHPLAAARGLRQRQVPIYSVGIGLAEPDDVAVRGVVVQEVVFAGDIVPVRVEVDSNGYERRQALVRLRLDGEEVARRTVQLTGRPQFEELTFKAEAPADAPLDFVGVSGAAASTLRVEVEPLEGEALETNNTVDRPVRIVDDKVRVLYIEGTPRWEYRYLRAILKRDQRIDVQFITTEGDPDMARASGEHVARFPHRPDEAFAYDLVILGDVKATVFTPTQLERIEQLVRQRGASLVLLAGPKHAPAEYLDTPIARLLPVWAVQGAWDRADRDAYPALTEAGKASTLMSLEPREAKNIARWAKVRPLGQVAPLDGAKPGAHVLAELSSASSTGGALPLVAWHRAGAGKVLFVGTDRLWRLRERVGDEYHARFWGQAIQFLTLSRLLGENRRIQFAVAPSRVAPGQACRVYAHVLNETFEPVTRGTYLARIIRLGEDRGDETAVQLDRVPDMPGTYRTTYVPTRPGRYRVTVSRDAADGASTAADAAPADFAVTDERPEGRDVALKEDLLEKLAATTGGRYLPLADFARLVEAVDTTPSRRTIRKEVELWDTWLTPLVFVSLVAGEWWLRRRRNLT